MGGERGDAGNSAGRAMLVALALVLQIAYLARLLARAEARWHWAAVAVELLALGAAVAVCGQCRSVASKLRWLALILILPLPGLCLYLTLGRPWVDASVRRRFAGVRDGSLTQDAETLRSLEAARPDAAGQSRYLWNAGGWPVYRDTRAEFHPQGALAFAALKRELRAARCFIFLEYHAVEPSRCFREIEDILAERAAAGVEVRLLYDDVGSLAFVGPGLARRLEARGVRCRVFNPMVPLARPFLNNRDHRKLTVIDGHTGLTGGYNLCDEYFAEKHPYGHWKDTGLLLRGPAVRSLTAMFLQMWRAAGAEGEGDEWGKFLAIEEGERAVERGEQGLQAGSSTKARGDEAFTPPEGASFNSAAWPDRNIIPDSRDREQLVAHFPLNGEREKANQAERDGCSTPVDGAFPDGSDRARPDASPSSDGERGRTEWAERASRPAPAENASLIDLSKVQPDASHPLNDTRGKVNLAVRDGCLASTDGAFPENRDRARLAARSSLDGERGKANQAEHDGSFTPADGAFPDGSDRERPDAHSPLNDARGKVNPAVRDSRFMPTDGMLPDSCDREQPDACPPLGDEGRMLNQTERDGHLASADRVSPNDFGTAQPNARSLLKSEGRMLNQAEHASYLASAQTASLPDFGWVQPYASSPLDGERVGENVYLNLIKAARRYVWIATPYLIPDDDTCRELVLAVKRGVDVRVIVPGIPDKRLVYLLTRANCARLAREDVRVSAYVPGFLHAKQLLADGRSAAIGTVNLDYRSLYQHFENGVLLHDDPAVAEIQRDFEAMFPLCRKMSECAEHRSVSEVAIQGLLRLLAPLM